MKALICGHWILWRKRACLPLKDGQAPENEPLTFFTKINLTLTTAKIFQFSFKISITTIQTFRPFKRGI